MTCRKQIPEVARDLARCTRHGTFATREVLAEIRARHMAYAEDTIYVHIASVMSEGAARHRGVHFDDLERVGRGVYLLVAQRQLPSARAGQTGY